MSKVLSRKVTIYINGKEVEATIKSLTDRIKQLEREQAKLPIGTQEYVDKSLELKELRQVLHEQKVAVNDLGNSWKDLSTKLADYSNMVMGVQSILEMGDAAIGSLKELAKDAAAMDDVYADVMKTTGLTKEQVLSLNEAFGKMDTRTSKDQLNQLAYEAGKLGISSEQAVLGFVSASDKINIALGDVLGEGAMVTIGKLADVYGKSTKQLADAGDDLEKKMLSIGSAINQLGQSSTANEGYMVEFLSRMGGVATQAKLSADAILGYASALDQDMMKQEMSATAFQKFIMQMIKKPAEFAKAARMEVSQFADLMQRDMNEALLRVLEGFQGEGGLIALQPIFEDLGLDAARAASVISSMANSIGEIREAQAIANEELTTGNSIIKEFNTKNNTMQAQAEKAKKAFENMRLELGNDLYPIIIHITKAGTIGLKLLKGVIDACRENKIALGVLAASVLALDVARAKLRMTSATLWLSEKASITWKKMGAMWNDRLALSEARVTAKRETAKLAALQQQLAINKKIIADKAEYVSMGANSVVLAAERNARVLTTQVEEQQTIATNAQTAAMKTQKNVMASTPWGAVILAITTFIALMAKAVKHQRRFIDETRETNKQISSETAEANYLFNKLEKVDKKSDEYRSTLEKLNELYPEVLSKYSLEEGSLNSIAMARQEVIDKIREQIVEQRKLDKLSEIGGNFGEQQEKILGKLRKILPKELFNDVTSLLPSNYSKEVSESEILRNVRQKVSGRNDINWGALDRQVKAYVKNVNDAYNETKEFESLYGGFVKDNEKVSISHSREYGEKDWMGIPKPSASNNTHSNNANAITSTNDDVKKTADTWKDTKDRVLEYISKIESKMKGGLAGTMSEVESEADDLRKSIKEVDGSKEEKDNLLSKLDNAVGEMRKKKVVEYLSKGRENAEKMRKEFSKPGDDKMFDDIKNASTKLEESLKTIDGKIKDLDVAKGDLISKKEKATSDELKRSIQEDIDNIDNAIKEYRSLSKDVVSYVYQGITEKVDTSKFTKPERTDSGWVSLMAQVDQNVAENASGWLISKKDSEEYRQKLVEIAKEYDDLVKKLEKNKSVELEVKKAIEERVASEKKKKPEEQNATLIANLEAEAAAHQANADAIDREAEKLKKAKEEKDELAKNDSLKKTFKDWINLISDFSDKALTIFSNINKILDNIAEKSLKEEEEEKDKSIKNLDEQLDQGLLSQKEYDKQKLKIEEDFSAKEKEIQLEQWRREKALNETQAMMSAALATIQVWAEPGLPIWAKIAMSAIVAAETLTNVIAISSQPEPYAKGGYVKEKTYFMAGEAGEEWVASNRLLKDSTTAPVIDALEQYQRGDKSAFSALRFARPNITAASNAAASLAKIKYQNTLANREENDEVVTLMRELATYLRDPNNRRAVISRETQQRFDVNENFLRSAARL